MKTSDLLLRPHYMDRIRPYIGRNIIKVLTGQRRVGKSYILKAVEEEIRQSDQEGNFITVNLENYAFSHITDAAALHHEIASRLSDCRNNYIFIDEVQEVEGFEKVVRSLNLDPGNDVYVTGSNSAMLSSEIASRLAGRSVELRVHPLVYTEFLSFHGMEDSDSAIEMFLRYGGMPFLRNLPESSTWDEYLSGLVDALVFRDVVGRNAIRNIDFLERLLMFMADNIGQLFTAKRISDYMKSQRQSATVTSVQAYAEYICQAFLVNRVRRWDVEGRRYFEIGEKYYFEDLGIRNAIVGYRPGDISGLLENAVYNQLVFEGFDVKTGSIVGGKEIDFIAEKGGERLYVQVAVDVTHPDTARREFGNLEAVGDNYGKILVTLRDSSPNTLNGIRMMSLRDFLTR